LRQQLDLLLRQFQLLKDDARDVPARSRKTTNIAVRDRIKINGDQHDRNSAIGGHD
jgi:hypothetical protein